MSRQLNVTEAQTHLSTKHVGQAVVVGRDDAGEITMRMTPAAAEALAEILTRYEAAHKHLTDAYLARDYDPDLWVHVGVDLLAAKAMQLSLGHVETSPVSGYLPPRSAAGAAAAVNSGATIAAGVGRCRPMTTDTRPPANERIAAAREASDAGMAQVEQHADPRVILAIDAAIERAIASGRRFSANTIRDQFPVSDEHLVGARIGHFAKRRVDGRRLMVRVGFEPSTLQSTHGHPIAVWLGWDAHQALSKRTA
ncbi:hypothetical protein GCM10022237_25680 [Nocardioides ginsengisoli]|uniref:DUF222 domain-containing protein n=1 Tax=Nocardioides ginsengisoli TaxID=363868 RepID=A0ABW3W7X7_9ACTN